MIKLVAIDMDGTLLSSAYKISLLNRRALKLAEEKGVKVVLCSGRRMQNILDYAHELEISGEDDFIVGDNGAGALRIKDSHIVYRKSMTAKDAKYIAKVCDSVNAHYTVHTSDTAITPRDNPLSQHEAKLNNVSLEIMHPDELRDDTVVTNVLVLDDEETLNRHERTIVDALSMDYRIVRTEPMYLEIMRKGVTKFNGIRAVADIYDIGDHEIMSIGDAPNDLEMILEAGIGVAMGNAQAIIKNAADYITRSNDEDGVAFALNRFLQLDMKEFSREEAEYEDK